MSFSRATACGALRARTYGEGLKYWVIYHQNRNQIRDPDLIYPGQIFALPNEENQQ